MWYLMLGLLQWPCFSLDWQKVRRKRVFATLAALVRWASCYYTPVYIYYWSHILFVFLRDLRDQIVELYTRSHFCLLIHDRSVMCQALKIN